MVGVLLGVTPDGLGHAGAASARPATVHINSRAQGGAHSMDQRDFPANESSRFGVVLAPSPVVPGHWGLAQIADRVAPIQ